MHLFDADGHVFETDQAILPYFDLKFYKPDTVSLFPSLDSMPRLYRAPKSTPTTAAEWTDFLAATDIEGTVLYPTAGLAAGKIRDAEWSVQVARAYNAWLHDQFCSSDPRPKGVAILPILDPAAAAAELERTVREFGFMGGMLPANNVAPRPYGDPMFDPIYEAATALDVPLAVHGASQEGLGFDFFTSYSGGHALGHPFSLMIQVTSMISEGIFDRYRQLRVAFLEGGCAWVPFLLDRLDGSFKVSAARESASAGSLFRTRPRRRERPAVEIFQGGQVFIGCELEEDTIPYVVDRIGSQSLVWASDFPHHGTPASILEEVDEFRERPDLNAVAKDATLRENGRRLYRWPSA